MKKGLCIVLTAAMVLSLGACGNGDTLRADDFSVYDSNGDVVKSPNDGTVYVTENQQTLRDVCIGDDALKALENYDSEGFRYNTLQMRFDAGIGHGDTISEFTEKYKDVEKGVKNGNEIAELECDLIVVAECYVEKGKVKTTMDDVKTGNYEAYNMSFYIRDETITNIMINHSIRVAD